MPAQVFVDESGQKGQSRHLFMVGLLAKAEEWANFSEEWQRCLRRSPSIKYFRTSEAAGFSGQFEFWRPEDRDVRVREFAEIANRHADVAIWCGVDLKAHDEILASYTTPKDQPYFLAFNHMCLGAGNDLVDSGHNERFEIIFDEHVIFGPRVKVWYPLLREIADPKIRPIMPVEPVFRSDKEFLPLQAADLFAWCARREVSGSPNPFKWVFSHLSSINISRYSTIYVGEAMQKIIKLAEEARQRDVPPETLERYRTLLGLGAG